MFNNMHLTNDFHLQQLAQKISDFDKELVIQTFALNSENYLKTYKMNSLTPLMVKFLPVVYTLIQKVGKSMIKVSLISYNEEIIEDNSFQIEPEKLIDDNLMQHIIASLQRQYKVCEGIKENENSESLLHKILIEKYGENIFFRSRTCSRLILDGGSCYECQSLKQLKSEEVKDENDEVNTHISDEKYCDDQKSFDLSNTFSDLLDETEHFETKIKFRVKQKKNDKTDNFCGPVNHICIVCDLKFSRENILVSHYLQDHPQIELEASKSYHKCPQEGCFVVFKHLLGKKMLDHLKKSHSINSQEIKEEKEKNTHCTYCAKVFNTPGALRKHLQNTHEAPVVPCHICGTFIKGTTNLNVHLRVTHGNIKYKCPEPGCTVEAKNKDHLKDHIAAIHRNEPRYICSICGTRYKYRSKWKYCEDKHKGKFLHQCDLCDKKFNDKRKFRIHQRVHTGEKPYMCPICNIRMARLDNLNAHTKKSHGVTWREAEKMTKSTISGIPITEHPQLPSII